ncbi:MAG: YceD family protein [Proteobacteria bacterium]|nr:YceD family protein [Pseudomonadota bacterium]
MAEPTTDPKPEFSRLIELAKLEHGPITLNIWAEPEERLRIAERFGLISLDALDADLEVTAIGPDSVRVTGRLHATLAQPCIASLEPVPAEVDDSFTVLWTAGAGWQDEDDLGLEIEVEGIVVQAHADSVDLGEAVAQQLALMLDPYPRVSALEESEVVTDIPESAAEDGKTRRPFAESEALKSLLKRLN